tara:strand:- start:356 stop:682 length:327 start_codon:yes stop_codon:yes gene_type:complete
MRTSNNLKLILRLFCILLLVVILFSLMNKEKFTLYGVNDLYCENKDLKKAYGPTMCVYEDGTYNLHTNCRCVDPITGYCKECYPEEHKPFASLVSKKKFRRLMKTGHL